MNGRCHILGLYHKIDNPGRLILPFLAIESANSALKLLIEGQLEQYGRIGKTKLLSTDPTKEALRHYESRLKQ